MTPGQYFDTPKDIDPQKVTLVMICEALPEIDTDYFYSSRDSMYVKNTIDAFNNAGIKVRDINELIAKGVYLTVAVKAVRVGPVVPLDLIKEHSFILEKELKMFPNLKAILLMGDASIKALNYIAQRSNKERVIPAGSTYKIRKGVFYFKGIRVFPSYLQTGKNFLIEKTKRQMVSEDIRNAFNLLNSQQ